MLRHGPFLTERVRDTATPYCPGVPLVCRKEVNVKVFNLWVKLVDKLVDKLVGETCDFNLRSKSYICCLKRIWGVENCSPVN